MRRCVDCKEERKKKRKKERKRKGSVQEQRDRE